MLRISVNLIFCNSNYIIIYMKKIICPLFLILLTSILFAERPLVRDIQARAGSGKKIRITWQLPQAPDPALYNLYVYRTTEQITSFKQLEKLEPVSKLTPDKSGYTDQVEDLRDYYYTVISETEKGLYDLVLLSFNSTVTGVHLAAKKANTTKEEKAEYETVYPEGTLRKTPLPYLDIIEGMEAEPLVSDKTAADVSSLTGGNKKASKAAALTPYIFEEDLVSPDGGDAYLLFEILKASFVTKKYKETIDKLNQLIGTNISEETRNRAYFYLGESQYFNKNYEEAVRSFVKVQAAYPTLSKKWLEASLDRI